MTTFLDDETFNTIARKLSEALNALHPKIGVWMGKGGGPEFDELAEAAGGGGEEFEAGVTAYWNINDVMVLLQEAREKPR